MKKYTVEDIKGFEKNEEGWIMCPAGDYTEIKSFPEGCSFGEDCRFGDNCRFGEWCHFGEGGRFGEYCRFGAECRFGAGCSFGAGCRFGENCRFGAECRFEGGHIAAPGYPMLTFGGFGSANRTTYAFNCKDGVVIRCECFSGSLEEFREKVRERHGNKPFAFEYLSIAHLIERRFSREGEVR